MRLLNILHTAPPRWLLPAVAAGLVCACQKTRTEDAVPDGPVAVSFGAYLSRGVATRGGAAGLLDNEGLGADGFGVFGSLSGTPDFMYDTKVSDPDGTGWSYSPVKYWPDADARLSFFAYAPHVDVSPDSGEPSGPGGISSGIVRLSSVTDAGDPRVTYRAAFTPSGCVDLCWAAPRRGQRRSAAPVPLAFAHALAALNVRVDAAVDDTVPGTNPTAGGTRIYVRHVAFEGFSAEGVLDLGSTGDPRWDAVSGGRLADAAVTVHDGRLDGLEALYAAPGEKPAGLNPRLVQKDGLDTEPGVTASVANLFDDDGPYGSVLVIPNGHPLKVTVAYDVETRDDKLASRLSDGLTRGSSTCVRVRQAVATGEGPVLMQAGRKYVLLLHVGMTGVRFEAGESDEWTEDTSRIALHPVTTGQEVVLHADGGSGWDWDPPAL